VDSAHHYDKKDFSIDALIEEHRRLASSKNPLERVVGALCLAAVLKRELAALSDKSIGKLMLDHVVWNDLNLLSPDIVHWVVSL
jgi:hypothetical protein